MSSDRRSPTIAVKRKVTQTIVIVYIITRKQLKLTAYVALRSHRITRLKISKVHTSDRSSRTIANSYPPSPPVHLALSPTCQPRASSVHLRRRTRLHPLSPRLEDSNPLDRRQHGHRHPYHNPQHPATRLRPPPLRRHHPLLFLFSLIRLNLSLLLPIFHISWP